MHIGIVWGKLQPEGIKLCIQWTASAHNDILKTRLFNQFSSQFFNPISLETEGVTLYYLIVNLTVIISNMIVYSPSITFWRGTHIRITRLLPREIARFDRNGRGGAGFEIQRIRVRERRGLLCLVANRGLDLNVHDVNMPEDPILSGGPVRNIMRNGVSPRRKATISPQKLTIPSLELNKRAILDGLPLDGGVKPAGPGLEHLAAGHPQEKGLVGGGEVLSVAALQTNYGGSPRNGLDSPSGALAGSIAVLTDGFLVLLSQQVLVVVTLQTHRFGVVKELHPRLTFPKIGLLWAQLG